MKPRGTPHSKDVTWKEGRRLRAWELHRAGWSGAQIAAAFGVSEAGVSQWITAAEVGGLVALRSRSRVGQGARLSASDLATLLADLERGAEAFGFVGDLWTSRRIAVLIERRFGVRYHPAHVSRLLHHADWTYQKPVLLASQRDEAMISDWLTSRWPALKKRPKTKAARSSSSMKPVSR